MSSPPDFLGMALGMIRQQNEKRQQSQQSALEQQRFDSQQHRLDESERQDALKLASELVSAGYSKKSIYGLVGDKIPESYRPFIDEAVKKRDEQLETAANTPSPAVQQDIAAGAAAEPDPLKAAMSVIQGTAGAPTGLTQALQAQQLGMRSQTAQQNTEARSRTTFGTNENLRQVAGQQSIAQKYDDQKTAKNDLAMQASGLSSGEITQEQFNNSVDQVRKQFGADKASQWVSEATRRAKSLEIAEARRKGSVNAGEDLNITASKELAQKYNISVGDAHLIINGKAEIDPAIPGNVLYGKTSLKLAERRQRLMMISSLANEMDKSANQLVQSGFSGRVEGTRTAQDVKRLFGKQSSPEAAFLLNNQDMIIQVARMDQGARLSDFDLKLWMAGIPSLQDVFGTAGPNGQLQLSPQYTGRSSALKRIVELETNSEQGPAGASARAEAAHIRSQIENDPVLDERVALTRQFQDGKISSQEFTSRFNSVEPMLGDKTFPGADNLFNKLLVPGGGSR